MKNVDPLQRQKRKKTSRSERERGRGKEGWKIVTEPWRHRFDHHWHKASGETNIQTDRHTHTHCGCDVCLFMIVRVGIACSKTVFFRHFCVFFRPPALSWRKMLTRNIEKTHPSLSLQLPTSFLSDNGFESCLQGDWAMLGSVQQNLLDKKRVEENVYCIWPGELKGKTKPWNERHAELLHPQKMKMTLFGLPSVGEERNVFYVKSYNW